jgi:hypothetical protein
VAVGGGRSSIMRLVRSSLTAGRPCFLFARASPLGAKHWPFRCTAAKSGNTGAMGFLWGLLRAVFVFFAVIVAILVVIDGTLLANLLGKKDE